MKLKRTHKLLIPAVLLIWAGVIFNLTDGCEKHVEVTQPVVSASQQSLGTTSDSLTLSLNYPDPFLKNNPSFFAKNTSHTKPQSALSLGEIHHQKEALVLPEMTFLGAVVSSTQIRGLLQLEGYLYDVVKGQSLGHLTVLDVELTAISLQYKDSLILLTQDP